MGNRAGLARGVPVLITVLALVVVVTGTGCAAAGTSVAGTAEQGQGTTQERFLDESGMQAEYRIEAGRLDLPPGVVFPEAAPVSASGPQSFGEGVGLVFAQQYWIFAWEREWLDQRGKDPTRENAALRVLKSEVPKCEFMTKYLDEAGRQYFDGYVRRAQLGDPSGFQQDVTVNPMSLEKGDR